MNKKDKAIIETKSEIMEEKKLNYKRFWGWGFGLILALMGIAYLAGLITFGTTKKASDVTKKAYFDRDSIATANSAKMDSTKK
ncbi:hypothetical protein [Emticicia aquatica]|nr:hypothetical protein [Emticicia aquatica]